MHELEQYDIHPEVDQYVIHPQERDDNKLPVSWIQKYLTYKTVTSIQEWHLLFDESLEKLYGKAHRERHEQEAYLKHMYGILEGAVMGLRVPKGTTYALKHDNPCYWYIPEGNEQQATLAIGHERQNTSGQTWVDWQPTRIVSPNELIIIPTDMVHAFISPGEKPFYASLVTRSANRLKPYRLSLRDKLTLSQPQN